MPNKTFTVGSVSSPVDINVTGTLTAPTPTSGSGNTQVATKGYVDSILSGAGYLVSETDPTVPSWAKQPSKPSYTATEVGALPNTTTIPSYTSQLINNSGFLTSLNIQIIPFNLKKQFRISGITSSNWNNVWAIACWSSDANSHYLGMVRMYNATTAIQVGCGRNITYQNANPFNSVAYASNTSSLNAVMATYNIVGVIIAPSEFTITVS